MFWIINVDDNGDVDNNADKELKETSCYNNSNNYTLEEKGRDTSHNTSIKNNNGGEADTSPLSPSSLEPKEEKLKSNPVERKIAQKNEDEESLSSTDPDANIGFNPIGEDKNEDYSINATIYGQQSVSTGSQVKLRLLDDINIDGVVITKNTVMYAEAKVSDDRVYMQTEKVTYKRKDYPLNARVYDLDGTEGVSMSDTL